MTAVAARPDAEAQAPDGPAGPAPARTGRQRLLARLRLLAIAVWIACYGYNLVVRGLTWDRPDLIAWTLTAVLAGSIGRRPLHTVLIDWAPFVALLILYDYSRGAAASLGRPTLWTPQVRIDTWLGFGHEPTVWLQEHLKQATAPPWEVVTSVTYVSYFLLPYVVAGALWLRSRRLWRRFAIRYVLISFIGVAGFILFPAAPPWAAAKCEPAQVASHPALPACMFDAARPGNNGLLGPLMDPVHALASPWVDQIASRGFLDYGLPFAANTITEQHLTVNEVAAIPSLHAATSLFVVVFLAGLVRRRWWPLLYLYPLVMAFTLVYSAEHYLIDILLGWAVTIVVCTSLRAVETRRARARAAAKVEPPPVPSSGDPACPPTATTP